MKLIRFSLFLLFIAFCSNTTTPISVSSLDNLDGSTTNRVEITGPDWENFIGKSSNGNFVALRVDSDVVDDGVLIVFNKEDLRKGDFTAMTQVSNNEILVIDFQLVLYTLFIVLKIVK